MAQLTYSPGTPGNVFSNVAVAAGANAASLVDAATDLGAKVAVKMATGASPPTVGTTFSAFAVAGSGTGGATTLSAAAAAGATSLSIASAAVAGLISKGEKVAIISATTDLGEVVTVSNVSGTTLTVPATTYAYSAGDKVFLIEQTASGGILEPGSSWSASSTYGGSIQPTPGWLYILQALNGDGAYGVTVTATLDLDSAIG